MLAHDCTGRDVTVDLALVSFMDSSGISALLHAHLDLAAKGHSLLIQGAHGPVERVLWITGATEYLDRGVAKLSRL
jgi:anti-anti-sigma factor